MFYYLLKIQYKKKKMNLNNYTQEEKFQYAYNLIAQSHEEGSQQKYDEGMIIIDQLSVECFPIAQIYLGDFLYHIRKDPNQAFQFYNAAGINGSAKGMYMVSIFLNKGLAGVQDQEKAFNIMYSLAQEGVDYAQLDLALFYLRGEGCEKNLNKAFHYFKLAAEQGNPVAQHDLGICYREGEGCNVDYFKAFYWFNKAAQNNNADGYYNLFYMFLHGIGVKKNLKESLNCCVQSARLGNSSAIYFLEKNNIDIEQYEQDLDVDYGIELENNQSTTPSFKVLAKHFSTNPETFELKDLNEIHNDFTNPLAFCLLTKVILTNEQWDYLFKNSDLNWRTSFISSKDNQPCTMTLFNFAVTNQNPSLFIGKEYLDLLIKNSDLNHVDEKGFSSLHNLLLALQGLEHPHFEIDITQLEYMIKNSNLKTTNNKNFTPLLEILSDFDLVPLYSQIGIELLEYMIRNSNLKTVTNKNFTALLYILSKFDSVQLYSQISDNLWVYLFENSNLKHVVEFSDASYSVLDYINAIQNEEWKKYLLSVYSEILNKKYLEGSSGHIH